MIRLDEADWSARAAAHRDRLAPVVEPHLHRRSHGQRHAVIDFLFEYYSFAPCHLMTWHPGWGVALAGSAAHAFLAHPEYLACDGAVTADPTRLNATRRTGLTWVVELLAATAQRPPRLHCFGLHEWAMVYRADQVRHPGLPLRLPPDELAAFVESQAVCCSHADAFRFFTPAARPLNRLQPGRRDQQDFEQPGCLHANMDLYKWSYKFQPWVPGELLAESFLLAVELRELDMAASPYDVSALGYEPVPVETEAGRIEYQRRQQALAERSTDLRARLHAVLSGLSAAAGVRSPA